MKGHGTWRIMAFHLADYGWFSVVLITYNEQRCDFTSTGRANSRFAPSQWELLLYWRLSLVEGKPRISLEKVRYEVVVTHSLVTCTITRGHKLKHKPLSFSMFNAYYQSYICVLLNYGKARLISVFLKRYCGTNKTTFVQQNMPDELRYQGKTNFITSDVNKQVYISQIQRLI